LELPYGSREEEELLGTGPELGTISIGVGYQLIRNDAPFALSVGFAFGIPVEATQEVEYEPTILIARDFGTTGSRQCSREFGKPKTILSIQCGIGVLHTESLVPHL
jgi:hypothetical protein